LVYPQQASFLLSRSIISGLHAFFPGSANGKGHGVGMGLLLIFSKVTG
jgi:hypothetical protein